MATIDNLPPPPARSGVWGVRLPDGSYLKGADGVSESEAWEKFIHFHGDSYLVRGVKIMATRNHTSPIISRRAYT